MNQIDFSRVRKALENRKAQPPEPDMEKVERAVEGYAPRKPPIPRSEHMKIPPVDSARRGVCKKIGRICSSGFDNPQFFNK